MDERINRRYMAGLIDGEGYIGIMPKSNGRKYFVPAIKISMTNPEVIRLICQTLGGHVHLRSHEKNFQNKGWNWKDSYCWEVRTWKTVKRVLEFVSPYLIVKKSQAEVMADFLSTQQENGGRYALIPHEVLDKRARLYALMRKLNHRGRSPAETKFETPIISDEAIVQACEEKELQEAPGNLVPAAI